MHCSDLLVTEADLVVVCVFREHVEIDVVHVLDQQLLKVLDEGVKVRPVLHQQWFMKMMLCSDLLVTEADLVVICVLREHVEIDVIRVLDQQLLKVLDEGVKVRPVLRQLGPTVAHDVVEHPGKYRVIKIRHNW